MIDASIGHLVFRSSSFHIKDKWKAGKLAILASRNQLACLFQGLVGILCFQFFSFYLTLLLLCI